MDDPEHDDVDDEECRARMLAIFVLGGVGMLAAGMALGFLLDWLDRTVLR